MPEKFLWWVVGGGGWVGVESELFKVPNVLQMQSMPEISKECTCMVFVTEEKQGKLGHNKINKYELVK